MALTNLFKTMKQTGLVKQIDQYLLLQSGDGDRVNITNSPSSTLGCSRANIYQRQGIARDTVDARVQRIFDNGHGMHERIQGYLLDMGVLFMDEVPLFNKQYEIQGHTDGIMSLDKKKSVVQILELKSINSRQFSSLKDAKPEHKAQAHTYIYCAEEQRLMLKEKYPTHVEFKKSELKRRAVYRKRYLHLKDGAKFSREEKIRHKVGQHIQMDNILYNVVKPIKQAVLLYECKDTQALKEFIVTRDEDLMQEILEKFAFNNMHWKEGTLPPRECRSKADGKWCSYLHHCFE